MSTALAPLWQISAELTALLDTIDLTPDEQKPEIEAEIERFLGMESSKVDQVSHFLASLEFAQKCAADEIARLQERKQHAQKAQERLEDYVCRVIAARGVKKLEGKLSTLSVRPSDAVKIEDESEVPAGFKTATVKMPMWLWHAIQGIVTDSGPIDVVRDMDSLTPAESISKDAIKKALKSGEDVPGATLDFRESLVRK